MDDADDSGSGSLVGYRPKTAALGVDAALELSDGTADEPSTENSGTAGGGVE
jgi:hypothetical protein